MAGSSSGLRGQILLWVVLFCAVLLAVGTALVAATVALRVFGDTKALTTELKITAFISSMDPASVQWVQDFNSMVLNAPEIRDSVRIILFFGGTYVASNSSFICPNGPSECTANMVMLCAQEYLPVWKKWDFMLCMTRNSTLLPDNWMNCIAEIGMNAEDNAIGICAYGADGEGSILFEASIKAVQLEGYGIPTVILGGDIFPGGTTSLDEVCSRIPLPVKPQGCEE